MTTLGFVVFVALLAIAVALFKRPANHKVDLSHLPARFVVFDLETSGLDPERHEIIEIAAIRVNRDATNHETFQTLVKPKKKVPKRIVELTGITQEALNTNGTDLIDALCQFREFAGDLRLVSFNADFDMAFLRNAGERHGIAVLNPVSCALKMARRAWPGRRSYRLSDLAKDGNLSTANTHRALADSQRALMVYCAAANVLRAVD